VKVAAYQAPLANRDIGHTIDLIREQVTRCESLGVEILCCPEGVLGGLADYADDPSSIAVDPHGDELNSLLAPLASDRVTTLIGFTERGDQNRLYNSVALFQRGEVVGIQRKRNPAINRSVYSRGDANSVFTIGGVRLGILICRDSTFAELADELIARGADVLFVPTNNGMPPSRGGRELVAESRNVDVALAVRHSVPVIRADVVGGTPSFMSYGASGIVDHRGNVIGVADSLTTGLVVAEIELSSHISAA
jgi:predicted amidohydrolase